MRAGRSARALCTDAGRAARARQRRNPAARRWNVPFWRMEHSGVGGAEGAQILQDGFERAGSTEKRYCNFFRGWIMGEVWFLRSPHSPTLSRAVQRTNLVRRSSIGKLQLKTALSIIRCSPTYVRSIQHANSRAVFFTYAATKKELCRANFNRPSSSQSWLHFSAAFHIHSSPSASPLPRSEACFPAGRAHKKGRPCRPRHTKKNRSQKAAILFVFSQPFTAPAVTPEMMCFWQDR